MAGWLDWLIDLTCLNKVIVWLVWMAVIRFDWLNGWFDVVCIDCLFALSIDFRMDWFHDWLISWLIDFMIAWFHDWLISWFIDFMTDWFHGWLISWLIWLIGWVWVWWVGWLVGGFDFYDLIDYMLGWLIDRVVGSAWMNELVLFVWIDLIWCVSIGWNSWFDSFTMSDWLIGLVEFVLIWLTDWLICWCYLPLLSLLGLLVTWSLLGLIDWCDWLVGWLADLTYWVDWLHDLILVIWMSEWLVGRFSGVIDFWVIELVHRLVCLSWLVWLSWFGSTWIVLIGLSWLINWDFDEWLKWLLIWLFYWLIDSTRFDVMIWMIAWLLGWSVLLTSLIDLIALVNWFGWLIELVRLDWLIWLIVWID